jgi:hypothetical protein
MTGDSEENYWVNLDAIEWEEGDIASGWHHIDITGQTDGEIVIYLDKVRFLNATDNQWTGSERFSWGSLMGKTSIDNLIVADWTSPTISISSSPTTPTTSSDTTETHFPFYILPVLITTVIFRKRK